MTGAYLILHHLDLCFTNCMYYIFAHDELHTTLLHVQLKSWNYGHNKMSVNGVFLVYFLIQYPGHSVLE